MRRPQLIKPVQTREVPQPEGKEGRKSQPQTQLRTKWGRGLKVKQGNFRTEDSARERWRSLVPRGLTEDMEAFSGGRCPQQVFREVPQVKSQPRKQVHRMKILAMLGHSACVMLTEVVEG